MDFYLLELGPMVDEGRPAIFNT